MARIVLIGNCQIEAMLGLYRQFVAASRDHAITYVRSYEDITPEAYVAIEAADILIEQVLDFKPKADVAGIATRAERLGVPMVHGGFLWPFAGQVHPNNPTRPFRAGGPYGAETSDAYLNRLIRKGVGPGDALERYLNLDVNAQVSLDRLLEVSLDKQRMRDEFTGFGIADLIAEHFRREPLFRTPYHPNARIAVALAAQLFAKLGVDPAETRRMQRVTRITPFPKEELPVHPVVARHYGLPWATQDRRYRFHNEGGYTFAEFVQRYVDCAWNEAIDDGMEAARTGDLSHALERLTAGVALSPRAAPAQSALAHVLEHLGRVDEALAAARLAIEIEPEEASHRLQYGVLLERTGDLLGAERQIRLAAALDPFDPHYKAMLANRLSRDGAYDEAAAVARHGLVAAPLSDSLNVELAHALRQQGDLEGAAAAFRRAAELQPEHEWCWDQLAGVLAALGRRDEALAALEQAIVALPDNVALRAQHAFLLGAVGQAQAADIAWHELIQGATGKGDAFSRVIFWAEQAGRLPEALLAVEHALRDMPQSLHLQRGLVQALEGEGRIEEALATLDAAIALTPADVGLLITRGDLMLRLGRLQDSEAAFQAALAVAPGSSHAHGQLGYVLSELGRHDEAITARTRAVDHDPGNPHRHLQLAHVLLRAGRFQPAVAALRQSVAIAPQVAAFRAELSEALNHAGMPVAAVAAAREAVALEPGEARFRLHLAHLLAEQGEYEAAAAALHAALAIDPGDGYARHQLSRMRTLLAAAAERESPPDAPGAFTIEPATLTRLAS